MFLHVHGRACLAERPRVRGAMAHAVRGHMSACCSVSQACGVSKRRDRGSTVARQVVLCVCYKSQGREGGREAENERQDQSRPSVIGKRAEEREACVTSSTSTHTHTCTHMHTHTQAVCMLGSSLCVLWGPTGGCHVVGTNSGHLELCFPVLYYCAVTLLGVSVFRCTGQTATFARVCVCVLLGRLCCALAWEES